jgi:hypothetical protein
MKKILFIIASILVLSSCKKDITPENPYENCPYGNDLVAMTDPTVKSEGIIPLTLNNYWIYSDSTWHDEVLEPITYDTLLVISAEKTGDDIWWKMSDGNRLCCENDKVYKLVFFGYAMPGTTVCPEKALLYFTVPADTTLVWTEWISDYGILGEAKLNKSTIHTQAGDFSDFFEYNQSAAFGVNIRWIKPGVGVIKTIEDHSYTSFRSVRTLISYKIL